MIQKNLAENHRATLRQVNDGRNAEWHDVLSLLRAVGDVTVEHNGKIKVTVGTQTQVLSPPRHKVLDTELLDSVRHLVGPVTEGVSQ